MPHKALNPTARFAPGGLACRYKATHWSEVGNIRAKDTEIIEGQE